MLLSSKLPLSSRLSLSLLPRPHYRETQPFSKEVERKKKKKKSQQFVFGETCCRTMERKREEKRGEGERKRERKSEQKRTYTDSLPSSSLFFSQTTKISIDINQQHHLTFNFDINFHPSCQKKRGKPRRRERERKMSDKRQAQKDQAELRQLASLPANKRCMDCTERGPFNVCLDFGTFICLTCMGIHREFSHRVKSVSMSTFKPEEMEIMRKGGNQAARDLYLAKWTSKDFPEPESGDLERIRQFIKAKQTEIFALFCAFSDSPLTDEIH